RGVDSRVAGGAQRVYGFARREVEDLERTLLVRGEREVALDHHALGDRRPAAEAELGRHRALVNVAAGGERRLLLVERELSPGGGRVLEGAPHDAGGRDRPAVVGEAD